LFIVFVKQADRLTFEVRGGSSNLSQSLQDLEVQCGLGEHLCYGLGLNIAPYCYHAPTKAM
jgi:hypothetical protein